MERPPAKGRGVVSNRTSRFEVDQREAFDDGWGSDEDEGEAAPLATVVTAEQTRRIITTNDSPDVPFNGSINPYKGCEHGCSYCFARPSHAYLGLSPGLDFETRITSKPEAPARLRDELSKPGYRCEVIALGANTDPYQPIERKLGITRGVLEVLDAFEHPVAIVTKSAGVLRDLDLLGPMAERRLSAVMVSITSLDPKLARRMEPRAAAPQRRLDAVRALAEAGVPVGVLASPMIPGLNDHELEAICEAAAAAGARSANTILLRLPLEIKDLFREWLEAHYPERARHVLSLVRDTRGGALYQNEFGLRMRGSGPVADLLQQRFALARRRFGLDHARVALDTSRFRVPPPAGEQLRLL